MTSASSAEPAKRTRIADHLRDHFLSVDPRWLGIFRIVLGSLLVVDGARRWYYARAFYTNDGIFPNHFSLFRPMGRDVFSVYHAFSTYGEVSVAFAITLVIFFCFLVGYQTKLFHILSAICITSLNARNIFVENGGTVVMNILTIWTLFLPLGRRISVDAVRGSMRAIKESIPAELNQREERNHAPHVSLVVLALILQWSVIYFFNTVHKSGVGWRNGSAIHYFMEQDRIVTWFAVWARDHVPYTLTQYMTWSTLVVEGTLAFILLVPVYKTWLRRIALLLAVGLHGGIAAMSRLGPFSYVMIAFFVLLLGADDWRQLGRWFGRPKRRRSVVYDQDCGICLWIARLLKRLDPFGALHFVGNAEALPEGVDSKLVQSSIVVVDAGGHVFSEERAVYEVLKALPFGIVLAIWLRIPGLSALFRALYRKVADNRLRISAWVGLGVCGVPALAFAGAAKLDAAESAHQKEQPLAAQAAPDAGEKAENDDEQEDDEAEDEEDDEAEDGDDEEEEEEEEDEEDQDVEGSDSEQSARGSDDIDDSRDADDDGQDATEEAAGANDSKRPPGEPRTLRGDLDNLLSLLREAAVAVLMVTLGTQLALENPWLRSRVKVKQPEWMAYIVNYPRIFQGWRMFAPEPPYEDGRIVVDGRTVDGRKLDPLMGAEPEFNPYTKTGWDQGQFWCDYNNRIRFPGHEGNRPHLRDYLLRIHQYSGHPEDRLVAFDVWWIEDKSPPPGEHKGVPLPPQKLLSYGYVKDSGATPWLRNRPNQLPTPPPRPPRTTPMRPVPQLMPSGQPNPRMMPLPAPLRPPAPPPPTPGPQEAP